MNLKLNVWRLQHEKRYVKVSGERQPITVLALRNPHDILRRAAREPSEQDKLKRLYRLYNWRTRTEDLPASKKLKKELHSVIEDLKKRGFIHPRICYGIAKNRKTGERQYKRAIILKATPWTRPERGCISDFFWEHIPKSNLGIYVYHNNKLYTYPVTATG